MPNISVTPLSGTAGSQQNHTSPRGQSESHEITLNVQVLDRTGRVAYSRIYSAQGLEPNIQVMVGHNAEASLNDALKKIVPQVVDDPALLSALLSLRAYPAASLAAPLS